MSSPHVGRFVWRELITPEPATAGAFYHGLFGWTARDVDMGTGPYLLLRHASLEEDVGGATTPNMEARPQWLDYLTVDDVDAALARVPGLGGQAVTEAMNIPGVGRFAIVLDPVGAAFALFRAEQPGMTNTDRVPPTGTFCWSQLMARDLTAAVTFYEALLGWTSEPMGEDSVVFKSGGTMRASAMRMPADAAMPAQWLQYVAVDDTDAACDKAKDLGARAFGEPTTMPGMGRFAVLADPTGAMFALWKDLSRT